MFDDSSIESKIIIGSLNLVLTSIVFYLIDDAYASRSIAKSLLVLIPICWVLYIVGEALLTKEKPVVRVISSTAEPYQTKTKFSGGDNTRGAVVTGPLLTPIIEQAQASGHAPDGFTFLFPGDDFDEDERFYQYATRCTRCDALITVNEFTSWEVGRPGEVWVSPNARQRCTRG